MAYLTPSYLPADYICRSIHIPNSSEWLELVNGALVTLINSYSWEQFGAVTPQEAADAMQAMFIEYQQSECMLGAIMPYATINPPMNTLRCDGSIHLRDDYPKLYDRIEPALIVDSTSFRTPDLRGRFIMASDTSNLPLAEGGENEVTLTVNQLAEHDHTTIPHTHTDLPHDHISPPHFHSEIGAFATIVNGGLEAPAASAAPTPAVTGATSAIISPSGVTINDAGVTVNANGANEPHNNIPLFTALNYCIVAR